MKGLEGKNLENAWTTSRLNNLFRFEAIDDLLENFGHSIENEFYKRKKRKNADQGGEAVERGSGMRVNYNARTGLKD